MKSARPCVRPHKRRWPCRTAGILESRRRIRPGRRGRTSACSITRFSSAQTTESLSKSGFSWMASMTYIRAMCSSFSSATHHNFSPPWLQFVALKQDADRLPAHLRCQFLLGRFSSAMSRSVHRAWSSGAEPHTLAMICRPCPISRARCLPGLGFSLCASSSRCSS